MVIAITIFCCLHPTFVIYIVFYNVNVILLGKVVVLSLIVLEDKLKLIPFTAEACVLPIHEETSIYCTKRIYFVEIKICVLPVHENMSTYITKRTYFVETKIVHNTIHNL